MLAVWEEGTPVEQIEDVLVGLGIPRASQGRPEINAKGGFADTSRRVVESGGLAISAHADREKGLLKLAVHSHMKEALRDPAIAAIEVADPGGTAQVATLFSAERDVACVRGSDAYRPVTAGTRSAGSARSAYIAACIARYDHRRCTGARASAGSWPH